MGRYRWGARQEEHRARSSRRARYAAPAGESESTTVVNIVGAICVCSLLDSYEAVLTYAKTRARRAPRAAPRRAFTLPLGPSFTISSGLAGSRAINAFNSARARSASRSNSTATPAQSTIRPGRRVVRSSSATPRPITSQGKRPYQGMATWRSASNRVRIGFAVNYLALLSRHSLITEQYSSVGGCSRE